MENAIEENKPSLAEEGDALAARMAEGAKPKEPRVYRLMPDEVVGVQEALIEIAKNQAALAALSNHIVRVNKLAGPKGWRLSGDGLTLTEVLGG